MQASEFEAIRAEMGLSQEAFARELGMSRVFVGMMLRGDRTIERRTALAALYLREHPEAMLANGSEA